MQEPHAPVRRCWSSVERWSIKFSAEYYEAKERETTCLRQVEQQLREVNQIALVGVMGCAKHAGRRARICGGSLKFCAGRD
jgi:hypothetical protein